MTRDDSRSAPAAATRRALALTRHALTAALLKVGCQRAVELDRGSHHPAFVHRTGTSAPPVAGYEATVLYALGRLMLPHAKPWNSIQ